MRTSAYVKCIVFGGIVMVGGPYLVNAITPTEDEIRSRYNPDLRARSLAERDQKIKEASEFVDKLKEYSKSEKPIWAVIKEEQAKERKRLAEVRREKAREGREIAEEIRRQRMEGER